MGHGLRRPHLLFLLSIWLLLAVAVAVEHRVGGPQAVGAVLAVIAHLYLANRLVGERRPNLLCRF